MNDHQLMIYLSEIEQQAQFAEFAYSQFVVSRNQNDIRGFFFYLTSVLNCAANISKIIWGSQNRKENREFRTQRISEIQFLLKIDIDSPLHSRTMRNNLEHFDERLDAWSLDDLNRGNFADMQIMPKNAFNFNTSSQTIFFRHYDPFTDNMVFFDDEVNIPDLMQEIVRVRRITDLKIFELDPRRNSVKEATVIKNIKF